MVKITNTFIEVTRGDSLRVKLNLNGYALQDGDVIKWGLKTTYSDATCVIEKVIPNDTLELYLTPSDTKSLDYGTYVWDCQITFANGDVNTFITKARFKITEEVV